MMFGGLGTTGNIIDFTGGIGKRGEGGGGGVERDRQTDRERERGRLASRPASRQVDRQSYTDITRRVKLTFQRS